MTHARALITCEGWPRELTVYSYDLRPTTYLATYRIQPTLCCGTRVPPTCHRAWLSGVAQRTGNFTWM